MARYNIAQLRHTKSLQITIVNMFYLSGCLIYESELFLSAEINRKCHIMRYFVLDFIYRTVGLGTRHPASQEQLRNRVQVVFPSLISLNDHTAVPENLIINVSQL